MKNIKLYEEFTSKTISVNNNEYNQYLNKYKNINRSGIVAWSVPGSQDKNFKMVREYINNGDSLLDYGCGIGDFIKNLEDNDVKISNYLGVDINENFISIAKETYPEYDFKTIKSINDVNGNWDTICAIGVFTWFITKDEFINTINYLYEHCNKQLILTLLNGDTPYNYNSYNDDDENEFWYSEYRQYSKKIFKTLFPDYNFTFKTNIFNDTLLVKIEK